jgi:hypothetical protein
MLYKTSTCSRAAATSEQYFFVIIHHCYLLQPHFFIRFSQRIFSAKAEEKFGRYEKQAYIF